MTVILERDRPGRSLLTVRCDGCPRSATTDVFSKDVFCALIGWDCHGDTDLCTLCQRRHGTVPRVASRIAGDGTGGPGWPY